MDFTQQLQEYVREVEDELARLLPEIDTPYRVVQDAMRYSVMAGGKRLRPVLALGVCDLLGGNHAAALRFGCAVECVHASSLIHDDLPCMDNDDLRRGKPSCHVAFDYATALLAGDALLLDAFRILAGASATGATPDMMTQAVLVLSQKAGVHGMVGGQVVDLASEKRALSPQEVELMHRFKTGALVQAACAMGAVSAGRDAQLLDGYANALGLAFQACDDILDVVGDEAVLGKPVGSDAALQKSNTVTLLGLDAARGRAKRLTEQALAELEAYEKHDFLYQLTRSLLYRDF